jgi:uracil-DNA glycosylase family protein
MLTDERLGTLSVQWIAMAEDLSNVEEAAAHCTRCPLYLNATQTVFGEGPATAAIMMVGEQPGDKEDIAGRPFVGPAGQLLDRALAEIVAYVTNAVKHFKNEPRGKRRLHKRLDRGEIQACPWWLDLELGVVKPKLVVALGATAAFALMGRTLVLARERGRLLRWSDGRAGLATIHPPRFSKCPTSLRDAKLFPASPAICARHCGSSIPRFS